MIARRLKPGVLEISNTNTVNEIESFTLLDLTDEEALALLKSIDNITINYSDGDAVYNTFKAIAVKRRDSDTEKKFVDVSKVFTNTVEGTSCLVREPKTHVIKIARRQNETNRINVLCISNEVREKFFADAKKSNYFKTTKKYAIDSSNYEMYSKWSAYMNDEYLKQLNKN